MSAYKQFNTNDVTITPFEVNKEFIFYGNEITRSDVGINIFAIENPGSYGVSSSGLSLEYDKYSLWNGVKQLYYSNYRSSSRGDEVPLPSLIPGYFVKDDKYYGEVNAPRYDNYLQTDITQSRTLSSSSTYNQTVVSIPQRLFGENIVPSSFALIDNNLASSSLYDDGEGNVLNSLSSNLKSGNIFYSHGLVILPIGNINSREIGDRVYNTSSYLEAITMSFSSTITLYENQYQCSIRANEFNYSQNPSLLVNDTNEYYGFVTGSSFSPYITTIGLYNRNSELIAVGKLSQPLPKSQDIDTNIIINFDI